MNLQDYGLIGLNIKRFLKNNQAEGALKDLIQLQLKNAEKFNPAPKFESPRFQPIQVYDDHAYWPKENDVYELIKLSPDHANQQLLFLLSQYQKKSDLGIFSGLWNNLKISAESGLFAEFFKTWTPSLIHLNLFVLMAPKIPGEQVPLFCTLLCCDPQSINELWDIIEKNQNLWTQREHLIALAFRFSPTLCITENYHTYANPLILEADTSLIPQFMPLLNYLAFSAVVEGAKEFLQTNPFNSSEAYKMVSSSKIIGLLSRLHGNDINYILYPVSVPVDYNRGHPQGFQEDRLKYLELVSFVAGKEDATDQVIIDLSQWIIRNRDHITEESTENYVTLYDQKQIIMICDLRDVNLQMLAIKSINPHNIDDIEIPILELQTKENAPVTPGYLLSSVLKNYQGSRYVLTPALAEQVLENGVQEYLFYTTLREGDPKLTISKLATLAAYYEEKPETSNVNPEKLLRMLTQN